MDEIAFVIDQDDTGWPPANVEWIYVDKVGDGYQVRTVPLFIKNMSVGDVIAIDKQNTSGEVLKWSHKSRSDRTNIWIMGRGVSDIEIVLSRLRALGCNTERLSANDYYAVDVPAEVTFDKVDEVLAAIDPDSIAFPSFRH